MPCGSARILCCTRVSHLTLMFVRATRADFRRAVHYASHQNGSLETEYAPLWADVERSLAWADACFGRPPSATNLWMGEEAARTTVHADLYDNVYAVVRGRKEFTLLPPQEGHLLQRRAYPAATYVPCPAATDVPCGGAGPSAEHRTGLRLELDEPAASVLWSPVDLEDARSAQQLRPIRASVGPGEVLLLPALWWHAVSQRNTESGECCVAINYWYDSGV